MRDVEAAVGSDGGGEVEAPVLTPPGQGAPVLLLRCGPTQPSAVAGFFCPHAPHTMPLLVTPSLAASPLSDTEARAARIGEARDATA